MKLDLRLEENPLNHLGMSAKQAALNLSRVNTKQKNYGLKLIAQYIDEHQEQLLNINQHDLVYARECGLSDVQLKQIELTSTRLEKMISSIYRLIDAPDPVGKVIHETVLTDGLNLTLKRVSIGVLGIIYDAHPHLILEIATLCLKSGNACIVRGSRYMRQTDQAMIILIHKALQQSDIPADAIQAVPSFKRTLITALLELDDYIDAMIPCGDRQLYQRCKKESTIPVLLGDYGVCHAYIDSSADLSRTVPVLINAKCQSPFSCNALDTLLIHRDCAPALLQALVKPLNQASVILLVDQESYHILHDSQLAQAGYLQLAQKSDYHSKWRSLTLTVKIVEDIDEALRHMRGHHAIHSDVIFTEDSTQAAHFMNTAQSAVIFVNSSTRFTDGNLFGLGGELGVSTHKLHVRGPIGLNALTCDQWVGQGDYLLRQS